LCLKLEIIKKIIAIGPIVVGIFYGIEYMLWGSVLISFIAYFLNSHYSADLIHYSTMEQIKDVFPVFTVSLIVSTVMWLFSLLDISVYIQLPIQIIVGLTLAFAVYERLRLPEYLEVKRLGLSALHKK
jgi:hypothetical protein